MRKVTNSRSFSCPKSPMGRAGKLPNSTSFFLSPLSDDGSENEASVSNKFVNDGSFLQQFLKLQREKSNAGRSFFPNPNLGFPGTLFPSFSPQKLLQILSTTPGMPQLQSPGFLGIISLHFLHENCPKSSQQLRECPSPNPRIPRNNFLSFSPQKLPQISPAILGMPQPQTPGRSQCCWGNG